MSKIEEIVKKASQKKVDFLVFPELFLTGYDLPYIMKKIIFWKLMTNAFYLFVKWLKEMTFLF